MSTLSELLTQIAIEPRDYQERLVRQSLQMYQQPFVDRFGRQRSPVDSLLLESPTGSGKTVIGLLLARCMQERFGYRVGWVAMRRNLLQQAAAENDRRNFGVDLQLISMFDKQPPPVDFLVIDEAQHDGARSMANLHGQIRPLKTLGLTATPFRSDRIRLCFEQVVRDVGIEQLIQAGYLSKFRHFTIDHYTPASVVETLLRERRRWGKSLLFFHQTRECLECQRLLADAGVASEVVTAQTHRERQIRDFVDGRIQVLISMAILAEGFDCPSIKTVFCRPSGKGCTIQMCGRVFRRHKKIRLKQIVQCRNTRYPITRTATPAEQYARIENRWKSLQLNDQIAEISARSLQLIAECSSQLPDFLTQAIDRAPEPDIE